MKPLKFVSIVRPKRKAEKDKKSPIKILIGDFKDLLPRGYEPVWFVRLPKKGGAK